MTFSEKNCNTCGQKCAIKYHGCSNWIPMQSGWIPVSERLPKPNEYVGNVCRYCLIQNKYGDMMVARWDGQGWEQMYQYGEYIEDEVIAWMPLPKPYEPQKISDHNLKMWEDIYAEEKRRERSE